MDKDDDGKFRLERVKNLHLYSQVCPSWFNAGLMSYIMSHHLAYVLLLYTLSIKFKANSEARL